MSHTLKIKCEIISPEYFRYYEYSLATDFFLQEMSLYIRSYIV